MTRVDVLLNRPHLQFIAFSFPMLIAELIKNASAVVRYKSLGLTLQNIIWVVRDGVLYWDTSRCKQPPRRAEMRTHPAGLPVVMWSWVIIKVLLSISSKLHEDNSLVAVSEHVQSPPRSDFRWPYLRAMRCSRSELLHSWRHLPLMTSN